FASELDGCSTMRLRLTIAYDGRPYAGWQSQRAMNTVQDVLEKAFQKISGGRIVVHGSGRTDAGVHALGQCAHADVSIAMNPDDWLRALNANLPPTIRIVKSVRVAPDFHARFSAKGKVYRYLIRNQSILPPLEFGRVWHVPQQLEIDTLRQSIEVFRGRHDFAAFSANRSKNVSDTVRTIRKIMFSRRGGLLVLTFEGDGFLYKMVRMLAAALVRLAQSREELGSLEARLRTGAPKWNHVAPAEGLYLTRVLY
ncbi:MAG TPA: tRNA pseudouridine(38-40) synthase TruA, partial [Terrimicrobiaceae bacterium]